MNGPHAVILAKKTIANLHPHALKFVVLKLLTQKVKMH